MSDGSGAGFARLDARLSEIEKSLDIRGLDQRMSQIYKAFNDLEDALSALNNIVEKLQGR